MSKQSQRPSQSSCFPHVREGRISSPDGFDGRTRRPLGRQNIRTNRYRERRNQRGAEIGVVRRVIGAVIRAVVSAIGSRRVSLEEHPSATWQKTTCNDMQPAQQNARRYFGI